MCARPQVDGSCGKTKKNEFSLTASWMPLHFDPDDNDDPQMKHLDERKASAFRVAPITAMKTGAR